MATASSASSTAAAGPPTVPTLDDVRAARARIAPYLSLPTPLIDSPALSEELGAEVAIKLESATPIAAFKVRGGINLVAQLSAEQRQAGVVTASTGNHAQSIAYGARLFEVPARIYMPAGANPDKVAAVRRLGAEAVLSGERFDDAFAAARQDADRTGARLVHVADEPQLIAGVATAALEVLEDQQPDTELVITPLGGGSGACGWLVVRDGLGKATDLWAVQSAQSPAAHDSWHLGEMVSRPDTSVAEGLATGEPFALPFAFLQRRLRTFLALDDDLLLEAVRILLERAHLLAEPAGAAAVAGAFARREQLAGKRVVVVVSGANITRDQLRRWL